MFNKRRKKITPNNSAVGQASNGSDGKPTESGAVPTQSRPRFRGFFWRKRQRNTTDAAGSSLAESRPVGRKKGKGRQIMGAAAKAWKKTVNGVGFSVAFSAAAASSILLFRMLNRTKVYGLQNIPSDHKNILYCLNHNSLLDNFAFEAAAYVPKIFFKRKYLPINLADRKNFFGDPNSSKLRDRVLRILGRHFFRHLKAYPVDRKRGDMGQVDEWSELLKENIVIVFPEGTRSRTGEVGHGKPGVGKLIDQARPVVMPVYMAGTADVLGVGMKFPTIFKTIRVYIGKPMDLSEVLQDDPPEDKRERMLYYANISETVMNEVRRLNPGFSETQKNLPVTPQTL